MHICICRKFVTDTTVIDVGWNDLIVEDGGIVDMSINMMGGMFEM
jgi:hypothetical protein